MPQSIPNPLIAEIAVALASHLGSHSKIENLFVRCKAPDEIPGGNMVDKITTCLRAANEDPSVDAFRLLGCVLEDFMERPSTSLESIDRVQQALASYGLSYQQGGLIMGASAGAPSRSVETMIRSRDLPSLEIEFTRALQTVQ